MRIAAFFLALLPLEAHAACPNDSEIFSCTIKGKPLQICHWKGALIYNFGPIEKPELSIAAPLDTIAFTPWPGIGGSIWESVAFSNQGYTYEAWTSVERDPEATKGLQAGITVREAGSIVAELTCDEGAPSQSLDVIYGLKESVGQCRDFEANAWTSICN